MIRNNSSSLSKETSIKDYQLTVMIIRSETKYGPSRSILGAKLGLPGPIISQKRTFEINIIHNTSLSDS